MKKTIILVSALVSMSAYSQVGINTETPKATLDVVGKPTNTTAIDGVIIPRITGNELKAKDALYGADQTGTIIYATAAASPTTVKTAEITAAGFYYFNGSIWKSTAGAAITDTNIYTQSGIVTAGANRTATVPDATSLNFSGVAGGSIYAWTDSGTVGLYGYDDLGRIQLATYGNNADVEIETRGATSSDVLLQSTAGTRNVGIGTQTPTAKLHSNGTVRLEGLATTTTNTSYLTTDTNGNVTRTAIPTGQWQLLGNTATTAGTNFIGTTDNTDFVLKRNNLQAGLLSNNTSVQNTGFGTAGIPHSSTGIQNSGFGALSLGKNTTGSGNSAFGSNALAENTTGNENSAFGANVLKLSSGSENSAFGYNALASMTSGDGNSVMGARAAEEMTTGSYNTIASGYGFDGIAAGSYNSVFGDQSVIWGSAGTISNNCILGASAADYMSNGQRNIAIGADALNENENGTDNVAIGFNALDHSSGSYNVAVGNAALDPAPNLLSSNNNTAIGYFAANTLTTGANNTTFGLFSGRTITTGSNNIAIGYNAEVPTATSSNQIRMGNTAIASARVQVAWTITSDKRWKNDIKDSDLGLDFIKQLRPVSYIRKNDESKKTEYGFIAQELQDTLKKNGAENSGIVTEDDKGMLSVRYNDLFAPIVKAIQEQQKSLEREQERLNQIEAKLVALEKK